MGIPNYFNLNYSFPLNSMLIQNKFIENWVDRELKSIIKTVQLFFVCNYNNCFPRSGHNFPIEPVAHLIVSRILNNYEKHFFLCLKYIFDYPIPQLSKLIMYYASLKIIYKK